MLSHWQLDRFVVCVMDCTIWPANTKYVQECLELLRNVCALSSRNVGHVQLPLLHASSTIQAVIKHQRKIEDALMSTDIEMRQGLTLLYAKDSSRASSDRRANTQACITVYADKSCKWIDCDALSSGTIGPLPLIRVSEMAGYDAETGSRPSAAARVEQMLYFYWWLVEVSRHHWIDGSIWKYMFVMSAKSKTHFTVLTGIEA